MAVLALLASSWAPVIGIVLVGLFYVAPDYWAYRHLRGIPAPSFARFTRLPFLFAARRGQSSETIRQIHERLGPIVVVAPNNVSIADERAVQVVYGHGNGLLKSDWYDGFVSLDRSVFSTRDRGAHARKRKIVSHPFAAKTVREWEPIIEEKIELLIRNWDRIVKNSDQPNSYVHVAARDWLNFLTFDIIGDLAFGTPFGMLQAGKDVAICRLTPEADPVYVPAIKCLADRGEVSNTFGALPGLRRYAKWIPDPFFQAGVLGIRGLIGIATAQIGQRYEHPEVKRRDLLARLQEGKDDKGECFEFQELVAEAVTLILAGSDTLGISLTATLYNVATQPRILQKLQTELDSAIPSSVRVPSYDMIKDLPYLDAVCNEALRHHTTIGHGLPREVPADSPGVQWHGHLFPPGTVLSVPTYTLHRSKEIWGLDADEFRPERWEALTTRQKNAFIPFSLGPRGCVGRNLAEFEMKKTAATLFRRYDVVTTQKKLSIREGLTRNPGPVDAEIRLRDN